MLRRVLAASMGAPRVAAYQGIRMEAFAGLGIVFVFVGLFLAVLWFFLPFAVFGTKPLIEKAIKEAQEANAQLKVLIEQQRQLVAQQQRIEPPSTGGIQ
jgi:hypothetical protein